jgi:hypothetical protein
MGEISSLLLTYNRVTASNTCTNDLQAIQCAHGQLFGSACHLCFRSAHPSGPTVSNHSTSTLSTPSISPVSIALSRPMASLQTGEAHYIPQDAHGYHMQHLNQPYSPGMLQFDYHEHISDHNPSYNSATLSTFHEVPNEPNERENITKNQDGKYQCDICLRNFRRPSRAQTCRNGHEGIKSCPCDGICGDPDWYAPLLLSS